MTLALAVLALASGMAQQNPTADEQLLIYELNRARQNPHRYASENGLGSMLNGIAASPPLALNPYLVASSRGHAQEMATNDYFGHQSAVTNKWPNEMARDAGYALTASYPNNQNNIESLAAGYSTFQIALRALLEDAGTSPPGHRYQLLATGPGSAFWLAQREIGAGHASDGTSTYVNYYSIHTAFVNSGDLFLTGVVYADANANLRYDLGEGIGGVTVSIGGTNTTTNSQGGWSIPVTNGSYAVTASGGGFSGPATANVTVSGSNIEVDFISGTAAGEVAFANQPGGPAGGGGPAGDSGGGGGCGLCGLEGLLALGLLRFRRTA
jgi:hypothetical protein